MRDAAQRILQAADIIGIRGVVVHAISPEGKAFYLAVGLEVSPVQPMLMMATLADCPAVRADASDPRSRQMSGKYHGTCVIRHVQAKSGLHPTQKYCINRSC